MVTQVEYALLGVLLFVRFGLFGYNAHCHYNRYDRIEDRGIRPFLTSEWILYLVVSSDNLFLPPTHSKTLPLR